MYDFFYVKTGGEYLKLPFSEIVYVEAVNKYIKIVTTQKYYLISATMSNIGKMLPIRLFRRIHRSYIVSLQHAHKFDNNAVYIRDKKLPIGKNYKQSLLWNIPVLFTEVKPTSKPANDGLDDLLRNINPQ